MTLRLLDRVEVTLQRHEDEAFIQDTWANAYRDAEDCADMPKDAFHLWHRRRRNAILTRPGTLVLVARDRERPLWIAGYGVFEHCAHDGAPVFAAHWLYCKKHCKRQGVGGRLLATALERIGDGAEALVATHRTWFAQLAEKMGFRFLKLEELYGGRVSPAQHDKPTPETPDGRRATVRGGL